MSSRESPNKVSDNMHNPPGPAERLRRSSTNLSPERERTDESLRQERDKTDLAVAARQEDMARAAEAMVDHARTTADAVLSVARENADALLDAARDKADERHAQLEGDPDPAALSEERALADQALRAERAEADELLHHERLAHASTLRGFLPIERESTDHSLRSERIRADQAVVNRDDFLAIVAHDLRDLLGGITLSTKVLELQAQQNETGASTLAETVRIGRHVVRMERLIGDLVDLASVDAGKLAVAPTLGDLAVLIAEAGETFQAAAAARGITLECRVAAMPLRAAFDHHRILQVLGNLVSNALKYTPRGGKISLGGEIDGGGVRLTVSDTGCGIPEEALETVFKRFSQVGANEHGGLGLGLYISRCLVEAHGGTIRAERRGGAGTCITLRLPAPPSTMAQTGS